MCALHVFIFLKHGINNELQVTMPQFPTYLNTALLKSVCLFRHIQSLYKMYFPALYLDTSYNKEHTVCCSSSSLYCTNQMRKEKQALLCRLCKMQSVRELLQTQWDGTTVLSITQAEIFNIWGYESEYCHYQSIFKNFFFSNWFIKLLVTSTTTFTCRA